MVILSSIKHNSSAVFFPKEWRFLKAFILFSSHLKELKTHIDRILTSFLEISAFSGNIILLSEWKTVSLFATSSTYFLRGKTWTIYTEKRTHLTKGKSTIIVYFMVYRLLFRLRVLYIIQVCGIIEIGKNNKSSKIYKAKKIACRWE